MQYTNGISVRTLLFSATLTLMFARRFYPPIVVSATARTMKPCIAWITKHFEIHWIHSGTKYLFYQVKRRGSKRTTVIPVVITQHRIIKNRSHSETASQVKLLQWSLWNIVVSTEHLIFRELLDCKNMVIFKIIPLTAVKS